LAHPAHESKWFDLVKAVVEGRQVRCQRGGKEVHAADVAKAVGVLLAAPPDAITGEAFNCYDLYVSEWDVAHLTKQVTGSASTLTGQPTQPKHEIVTDKLRRLGMEFGGRRLLEQTIGQLVEAARQPSA
jgi:hypothetical protein